MAKRLLKKHGMTIRFTAIEKQEIKNTAHEKGMTISEYIRDLHRKEIYSKIK